METPNRYPNIFSPVQIGRLTLKNRIEFPPVGPLLAAGGLVTRELIEWGRTLAKGGAAIVTLGDSAVMAPSGITGGSALNLGVDQAVNPLNRWAETIQRYGAAASIQLNHHSPALPSDLGLDNIRQLIAGFAAAAERCRKAGLDMIMLHGAHGQLISRFVSPRQNTRTDNYGGPFPNRARLIVEILEAIRQKVGDALAIEYRLSGEELVPGGLTLEEQLQLAELIQDKIDLLHVSAGRLDALETLPRMFPPVYLPRGENLALARRFKQTLRIPIAVVGGLDLDLAEQALREKQADIAALGRALIADPDSLNKAARGLADRIRPCVRCNRCIDRTHNHQLSIRCAVNPLTGREAEPPAPAGALNSKKVVVIGGGPAGMEAARRAAGAGHKVVLFEKEAELGGNLRAASAAPFKADLQKYLEWAVNTTLKTPGLIVKTGVEPTAAQIQAEQPDILILAAGAVPVAPEIPGIHKGNVLFAAEVESGKVKTGQRVVVAGAGLTGSETALRLAREGKQVILIDRLPPDRIDADLPLINLVSLRGLLTRAGVETRTEVQLTSVTEKGVVVTHKNGVRVEIVCDSLVLALGLRPRAEQVEQYAGLAPEIRLAGDLNHPGGNLYTAVSAGCWAGLEI